MVVEKKCVYEIINCIPQKARSMDMSKLPRQKQFSKFWGTLSLLQ